MANTQVSTAKKLATAAFAGFVALSLMAPTQLAFAEYSIDDSEYYPADQDKSGEGSGGGTWEYAADGYEMTLVDYVGGAIEAYDQDLNIQLQGDSTVNGGIEVEGGNLTITGDDSVYGLDKPSLTIAGEEAGEGELEVEGGDLTIKDANIYADASQVEFEVQGNITIENSATWRGGSNDIFMIAAYSWKDGGNILLKGSEINATGVYASGTLAIDNTNLTVLPDTYSQELIDSGYFDKTPWVVYAVNAIKGIELIGESNGEVVKYEDELTSWYYLTTGDNDKVELRASTTPAYWGPQGMPKTGDSTLPLVGFGIAAAFAGLLSVYSLRQSARNK